MKCQILADFFFFYIILFFLPSMHSIKGHDNNAQSQAFELKHDSLMSKNTCTCLKGHLI